MKKITNYKYDGSQEKEQQELRDLREQFTELPQSKYCKKYHIYPNFENLLYLKKKVEEGELAKKHIEEIQNIAESSEPVYSAWFYFKPDIHNNGGVNTTITRKELDKLIKRGNELTDVFFLNIYDIKESFKQGKLVIPDFLPEEVKKQLNNKNYNNWHNSLLKNSNDENKN